MAIENSLISVILKEKKITDFLESRGIFPAREGNNRLSYLCPIHADDSAPSFMVFTDGEHQTYKCFGCHSGTDIINLVCALDNISIKQAMRSLVDGLSIIQEDITDSLIDDIIKGELEKSKELERLMLLSGSLCREHLRRYSNDDIEMEFFIEMYKIMDKIIRSNDVKSVKQIYSILCDKGIPQRIDLCLERKENRILNEVKAWKK
jgi:DNA primase